ncbi:HNH endonuclease signature motif containing protein [Flexivirga caeni]|uniref:HNH endonuclease n=1 Tax=Flexivirga caeni TaxID=2294115 RepID=A0A3M9MB79_9MICO|nr:HNH endonuclease signature motif containing protein [Flexivirga caeni]RNI22821.1 HNH endonuclease [Flexivirga caeni]
MTTNNPGPLLPGEVEVSGARGGDVSGDIDGMPTMSDVTPAPVVPGRAAEILEMAREFRAALDEVPGALYQLGEEGLSDLMTHLMGVHVRAAQVATVVVAEAHIRGEVNTSVSASGVQWITAHAVEAGTMVEPRDAKTMAVVAEAYGDRRNAVVADAVREGRCTLAVARAALSNTDKVAPVLPGASRDELLGHFLHLDPALGSRGVSALTRMIIAQYAPDTLSAQDAKLEAVETLSWFTTPTGMTRLTAELAPASAAVMKSAILALSAPQPVPCDEHPSVTVADERTPGKRRADALTELITAAAKVLAGDASPTGAAATALVTMDLDVLTEGVGHGQVVATGDVLDAGAARRLACDAQVIPIVLGARSEPLDVGRKERLVTKGLRTAVITRDHGCTFPGCDRPPGMCEVHHVNPWWAGGETCLINSAMLCAFHHHLVHRLGLLAAVTAAGVCWDLTPDRMPTRDAA